ncbi:MAG: winged helix DNA-binding protein [Deltaproteobacteria bacterium]|nr:winged helix DNA-binding protein [Deltaproteobacteria bacterium]
MKSKSVKIGIRNLHDFLEDAKGVMKKIEKGEKVRSEKALYFESIEGFRKALTPKRLELLHVVRESRPKSLQELSRLVKRDMKSIVTDINILESLDLIDMKRKKNGKRETTPKVDYDRIDLQIAV